MNSLKLRSLIGFIKHPPSVLPVPPKEVTKKVRKIIKQPDIPYYYKKLANYYNFTNKSYLDDQLNTYCLRPKCSFHTIYYIPTNPPCFLDHSQILATNLRTLVNDYQKMFKSSITPKKRDSVLLNRSYVPRRFNKPPVTPLVYVGKRLRTYTYTRGVTGVSGGGMFLSLYPSLVTPKVDVLVRRTHGLSMHKPQKIKFILLKLVFKKIQNLSLILKQNIKQWRKKKMSFLIKILNIKIKNTFKFLREFYIIIYLFQKTHSFISRNERLTNHVIQKLKTKNSNINSHNQVFYAYRQIRRVTSNKKIWCLINNINNGYKYSSNRLFVTIRNLILNLASYVTFFLNKFLWKWAKKRHNKASRQWLLNKYWIFIQRQAKFYCYEK